MNLSQILSPWNLTAKRITITIPPGIAAYSDNTFFTVDVSRWFGAIKPTDKFFFSNHGYAGNGAPIIVWAEYSSPTELLIGIINVNFVVTSAGELTVDVLRYQ
jgi:hypothetical protein